MTLPFKIAFDDDLERPVLVDAPIDLAHDHDHGIPITGDLVTLKLGVEVRTYHVSKRHYDYAAHPPKLTIFLTDRES